MSRRFLLAALLALCGVVPCAAVPSQATVMLVTTDCHDYFVVDTGDDRYALLQWYGGYTPEKGDQISGDFAHYGVQDMLTVPGGRRLRVWVDDYDLTQDAINDKLADKCN